MTHTLTDRANSGEIPRYDSLGAEATRDLSAHLRRRDTTGEATRNLAHEIAGLPPRRRPANDETAKIRLVDVPLGLSSGDLTAARRIIEIDDTVTFHIPETTGCVDLQGPQPKPTTPLPKPPPKYDMVANIDGELRPALPLLRKSAPYVMPADRAPFAGPRHARPAPLWTRLAILVGGAMAAGGGIGVAIILAVVR